MFNQVINSENRLFLLAREGSLNIPKFKSIKLQSAWEFLYPLFVFFYSGLVPFLSAFCAAPIILLNLAREGFSKEIISNPVYSDSPLISAMFLVFSFLPIFLFVWGWLVIFERRMFWTTGLERNGILKKYGQGALIGILMMTLPVALLTLCGCFEFETDTSAWVGWPALPGIFILFAGWVVQGAAEETLTRGFLLPIFGIRFGLLSGVIVSSVLFASLHLYNANLNIIAMLNLFLFGIFASLYAMWEGSLWGIFAIHSLWNWTQGNLFGLHVSGSNFGGTTLFNLIDTGPSILTGGAFGPEGGLAITAMLLAGCLFIYFYTSRKSKSVLKPT